MSQTNFINCIIANSMKIVNCKLRIVWEWIIDILLPRFCVGCGREGLYICKDCEIFLSEVDPRLRNSVSKHLETEFLSDIISIWEYEGLMEKLIYKIKFDGCYDIIDELVEKAMAKVELNLPNDTIITFVPMWKKKERLRGFNQSELIAKAIGKSVQHRVLHILEKVRDNRSQVGLGPREREENVKGVFSTLKPSFNGEKLGFFKNVLLIDDVYTTGATMNECIKVLKKAGVKNIWGFTIARKLNI